MSSVFFTPLPDQVLVYGDCTVSPDPSANDLIEITMQSTAPAQAFGIPTRVAMISYSIGDSGSGVGIDKIREVIHLAHEQRPNLLTDGPLRYNAAAIAGVGRQRAPDSPMTGQATVFIFPNLNTGSTVYRVVRRSADRVSVRPMLQGLRKPVNDLLRGTLMEGIVYTVALTAIQADTQALA